MAARQRSANVSDARHRAYLRSLCVNAACEPYRVRNRQPADETLQTAQDQRSERMTRQMSQKCVGFCHARHLSTMASPVTREGLFVIPITVSR